MILTLAALAATGTIWSAGPVIWTTSDVTIGIYSERRSALARLQADEREHERDDAETLRGTDPGLAPLRQQIREHGKPYCGLDAQWSVLSVVGPLVSVEQHWDEFCIPAAHPWGGTSYTARDARHPNRLASLLDWFPEHEVVRALENDRLVKNALGAARPRSAAELLKALAGSSPDCAYGFDEDLYSHFAFHHLEGNQVAVRIGLSHGCEAARGNLTQLGILLAIPQALRGPLEAAAARRGVFLMKDAEAIAHGRAAALTWGRQ